MQRTHLVEVADVPEGTPCGERFGVCGASASWCPGALEAGCSRGRGFTAQVEALATPRRRHAVLDRPRSTEGSLW